MDKVTFEDVQLRLKGHHELGLDNMCTASPLYLVQKKVIDWGYLEEFAEHHALYCSCDDTIYDTVNEFFEDYDEDALEYFTENTGFGVMDIKTLGELEEVLNSKDRYMYDGYQLLHGNSRYETVNIFLTYNAAKSFLESKGEVGTGRIYVDSLYRSGEFRELLNLIVEGKLKFEEK